MQEAVVGSDKPRVLEATLPSVVCAHSVKEAAEGITGGFEDHVGTMV